MNIQYDILNDLSYLASILFLHKIEYNGLLPFIAYQTL